MAQLQNQLLNDVLVRIHRGLLSYAGECWPWTNHEEASERDAVSRMVAERNERVAQIVELLAERDWIIDFSTYPIQYTDLHYVSLDYLLDQIIAEQEDLLKFLEQADEECAEDALVRGTLESIRPETAAHLEEIQKLAASRKAHSPSA